MDYQPTKESSLFGVKQYTYFAFISYKREDSKWAVWLQNKLQQYRLPSKLCKKYAGLPRRLTPVFLDKTDLTSGALDESLKEQASASRYLILICSKHTHDRPQYIDQEIQHFIDTGHEPTAIIPFIVDKSASPEKECFPPKLQKICEQVDILGININDAGERLAFLKVVAYMQQLKLTEIESADDRRRRRNRRLTTAGACLLTSLIATTGLLHYDYYIPKLEYYVDYATRYGVPVGIGKLSADDIPTMNEHYTIESVKHQVRELRRENAFGTLTIDIITERKDRPAKATYEYQEDGTLNKVTYYNASKDIVQTMVYTDDLRTITLQSSANDITSPSPISKSTAVNEVSLSAQDKQAMMYLMNGYTSITHYTIQYDDNGYETERLYVNAYKTPISDSDGVYGLRYTRDELGREAGINYLTYIEDDNIGKRYTELEASGGIAGYRFSYNGFDLTQCAYVNSKEELVANVSDYSIAVYEYDALHRITSISFRDANGAPCISSLEVAKVSFAYDEHGNRILAAYYDVNGDPVLSSDGYAGWESRFDDKGFEVQTKFFDVNGNAIRSSEGSAGWKQTYDENDNVNSIVYLDEAEQPIISTYGMASVVRVCDTYGNEKEVSFFDEAGEPMLARDGVASITRVFDDYGRPLQESYFGIDGKPIMCIYKYAMHKLRYDERGNIEVESFYDIDGNPTLSDIGIASAKYEYDEYGNIIDCRYFGIDGEATLSIIGVAQIKTQYDIGKIIKMEFLDTKEEPILNYLGYAGLRYEYCKTGDISKIVYTNENNEPIMTKLNYAEVRYEYDSRGNNTKRQYLNDKGLLVRQENYGADGKLALNSSNYAVMSYDYNERGYRISQQFYGVDNQPIMSNFGYAKVKYYYDENDKIIKQEYFNERNELI